MRLRAVRRRGIRLARRVTVIDRDELLALGIHLAERAQLLAWVDPVARRRRVVGVRAAHRARRDAVLSGDEAARLVGSDLAGVGHDRVAYRLWERERVGYAPPAIAGITMTSAPSGTRAAVPPCARASSSPIYTFT